MAHTSGKQRRMPWLPALLLGGALFTACQPWQTDDAASSENDYIVRALIAAWQSADTALVEDLFWPDATYDDYPNQLQYQGLAEIVGYVTAVHLWGDDVYMNVGKVHASAYGAVAEWEFAAVQNRPMGTFVPVVTGREVVLNGVTIIEVAGGRIAFSFLTRTKSDFRLAGQTGSGGDAIEELPDISFANTSTFIESRVGDYWIGATWARALGERVGLGVSTFFATRSQNVRIQNASALLRTDNRVEASSQIRDFSFYNVRLLWKVGLSTDIGRWQLGLTVTTPSISLFGDGTRRSNRHSPLRTTLPAIPRASSPPTGSKCRLSSARHSRLALVSRAPSVRRGSIWPRSGFSKSILIRFSTPSRSRLKAQGRASARM